MSSKQLHHSDKRKLLKRSLSNHSDLSERTSQIQKRNDPNAFLFPAAFWDNLSRVDITKRALKELDRRNTQATLSTPQSLSSCSVPRIPVKQRKIAEQDKSSKPILTPDKYLTRYEAIDFKAIQRFARHGGPNLLDLRGVC